MQISVSGKKMDVGAALREHAQKAVETVVGKYFDRAIDADVLFGKEAHLVVADIQVNEGTGKGITIKAQGKEEDAYAAFDRALERAEKQLRRYKRRLKNHHAQSTSEAALMATKYVFSDHAEEEVAEVEDAPLIIAEKPTVIETMPVSDAVMRMNLANLPALMFVDKKSGNISVVYKRLDGNVSWVNSGLRGAKVA